MGMILLNESYDLETIRLVCRYLKRGYAVLVRTDTQWGIIAIDPAIIYEIKRRPLDKKIVKLVSPRFKFFDLSIQQEQFVKKFWPGSVTIIKDDQAFRLTNRRFLNAIIIMLGESVYCSSANISGGDPITTINEALTAFAHASDKLIGLIPSRKIPVPKSGANLPSTIVDIDYWYVVRKGARYEEVLSFLANKIIPSYDKQRERIEKRQQKLLYKVPDRSIEPYYGLPVIDVRRGLSKFIRERNNRILARQYLEESKKTIIKEEGSFNIQKPTKEEIKKSKKLKKIKK